MTSATGISSCRPPESRISVNESGPAWLPQRWPWSSSATRAIKTVADRGYRQVRLGHARCVSSARALVSGSPYPCRRDRGSFAQRRLLRCNLGTLNCRCRGGRNPEKSPYRPSSRPAPAPTAPTPARTTSAVPRRGARGWSSVTLGVMVELLTAVAAVIGALAGLVNSWQIARLTGRVDSIEQTQHHVLGALMHGTPKRD